MRGLDSTKRAIATQETKAHIAAEDKEEEMWRTPSPHTEIALQDIFDELGYGLAPPLKEALLEWYSKGYYNYPPLVAFSLPVCASRHGVSHR